MTWQSLLFGDVLKRLITEGSAIQNPRLHHAAFQERAVFGDRYGVAYIAQSARVSDNLQPNGGQFEVESGYAVRGV